MRKIALALVVAIGLGGCANLGTAFNFATASISNPVTKERLNTMENGAIVVFAGLNAYKQSCAKGLVEAYCKSNIAQIQVYTRQIPPMLTRLRAFVKNNDQVNAIVVYNELVGIIAQVKSSAAARGMPMGDV